MNIIIDVLDAHGTRISTETDPYLWSFLNERKLTGMPEVFDRGFKLLVDDNQLVTSHDAWLEWLEQKQISGIRIRDAKLGLDTESVKIGKAVDPEHYKSAFGGSSEVPSLQWLEKVQYEGKYRDPEKFKAAVELQIRKYLDRNGGKDTEIQELKKANWYLKFLIAYVANDNRPIRVANIEDLIS